MTQALTTAEKGKEEQATKETVLHFGEEAILETFLMLAAIIFFVVSLQYPAQSRLFPTLVLVPLILGLAAEIWGAIHVSKQALEKEAKQRRSTLVAVFWILVLLTLIYFGGLAAGIGLFPLLYMRLYCKESWKATIAVTLVLGFGAYLFLSKLNLPMFWGVMGDILGF